MKTLDVTPSLLEDLVRTRKKEEFLSALPSFLKRSHQADSLFQACDWLRRLGLYSEALKVLRIDFGFKPLFSKEGYGANEELRKLWIARILNLMGARAYSLQVLSKLSLSEKTPADSFRILGNLYLSQSKYDLAYKTFKRYFSQVEALSPKSSYLFKLSVISQADCLLGLGLYNEAKETLLRLNQNLNADETYLKAILHQALAEAELTEAIQAPTQSTANLNRAQAYLNESFSHFPEADSSIDYGIALKWLAVLEGLQNQSEKAKTTFSKAWKILYQPSIAAEAWLDIIRLKKAVGLDENGEFEKALFYPGLTKAFQDKYRSTPGFEKPVSTLDLNWVNLKTDEIKRPELGLGISATDRCALFLSEAHPWGINRTRLLTLIWPSEVFSILELRNRLDQIAYRTRKEYGVDIDLKKSFYSIQKPILQRNRSSVPELLKTRETFNAKTFSDFYSLKKTQASHWTNAWISQGYIHRLGNGKKTLYQMSTPTD